MTILLIVGLIAFGILCGILGVWVCFLYVFRNFPG